MSFSTDVEDPRFTCVFTFPLEVCTGAQGDRREAVLGSFSTIAALVSCGVLSGGELDNSKQEAA